MVHRQWRFALVALAMMVVLAACAPASARTTASPIAAQTPTAAPAITPDAAQPLVLVLPSMYIDQKTLITANRHYSDAVKRKGWNVEFYTVQSNDAGGTDTYFPYVNKQLCSGAARADGFLCLQYLRDGSADLLTQAKNSGQLYDCVAAAPQVVPQYWAKYQDQISAGKYGLALATRPMTSPISDSAFVVRKDVVPMVGKGLSGYNDLRALVTQMEQAHTPNPTVQAMPQYLLHIWIQQQGYLELFADAGIYARMDDPDAKPVLLEDIPSFGQFFDDMQDLLARGILVGTPYEFAYDYRSIDGAAALGPAVVLDYYYNFLYYRGKQADSWRGYTAFPILNTHTYADNIDEAASFYVSPRYDVLRELIIPARSRRAADAMAFIQWIYDDPRNADTVIYGQEGEDYSLQGQRVVLPKLEAMQDGQSTPAWQQWPGQYLFQIAEEKRILADAPENAEALLGDRPVKSLAAPWLARLYSTAAWEDLTATVMNNNRQAAMQSLFDLLQNPSGSKVSADATIKSLRFATTDGVLQPYLDVLAAARAAAQP